MIDRDTVGCSDRILAAIALSDRIFFIILAVEVEPERVENLARLLRKSVFLHERQDGQLDRGDAGRKVEHHALFSVFQFLFCVRSGEDGQEHAVQTDRGFDHVRRVALVGLRIEVLDLAAAELLVLAQVEVCAGVYAFQLLETEGEFKFDIGRGVGVVRQFFVIVEAILLIAEAQRLVP